MFITYSFSGIGDKIDRKGVIVLDTDLVDAKQDMSLTKAMETAAMPAAAAADLINLLLPLPWSWLAVALVATHRTRPGIILFTCTFCCSLLYVNARSVKHR